MKCSEELVTRSRAVNGGLPGFLNFGELSESVRGRCDQAIKGARRMSWRREAMKDVGACDKLRGVGNQALILRFLNGETRPVFTGHSYLNA